MSDYLWTRFVRFWPKLYREGLRCSPERVAMLLKKHPWPWHLEQDWTYTVTDVHGQPVESFWRDEDAWAFMDKAEALQLVSSASPATASD